MGSVVLNDKQISFIDVILRKCGLVVGSDCELDDGILTVAGVGDVRLQAVVASLDIDAEALARDRLDFSMYVDVVAEDARLQYLPSVGQAMTYQEKERQARAFESVGFVGVVPELVKIDVDLGFAPDARVATLAVIAAADYTRKQLTEIERARRAAGAAIGSAVTVEDLDVIRVSYMQSLGAI